jgi:hypothetical protein
MKTRIVLVGVLAAAAAFAQAMVTASGSGSGAGFVGHATFSPPRFPVFAVVGAAYSGEEASEQVQTLADGTRITHENSGRKMWRDAQGRTRTERPLFANPNLPAQNQTTLVEISDPVGGFQYILDTQNKVAHRMALPPANSKGQLRQAIGTAAGAWTPPPPPTTPMPLAVASTGVVSAVVSAPIPMESSNRPPLPPPPPANALRPEIRSESLGTKLIDGVMAEGRRSVMTYPTGMTGNDRPFSVTTDTWTSPDLKMTILSVTHDPRSGDRTFKIANLSLTPPDPTMFMAPADYNIVDEKDTFTIEYKGQ